MSHQSLIVCLSIVLFTLQDNSVQSAKRGWYGEPYDSTVDKLCGQFASDCDQMQSYMQGLSYRSHDHFAQGDFYFAYHDHVYSWQKTDISDMMVTFSHWPLLRSSFHDGSKTVDRLKALGKWNEIAWIKSLLDANGIDGNGVKLIRLRIYALFGSGPLKSQIEISFQQNGRQQVDTLLATNETGVAELRQDYMPECTISGKPKKKTYIFRYDDKGQVVVSWRKQQDSAEEGPFYMYIEQSSHWSYVQLKFYSSPPQANSYTVYTPLFTQLPIYGLIHHYVHLWDLPNHRVYYFFQSLDDKTSDFQNVSFEKYFDCQVESTTSATSRDAPTQDGPTQPVPSQEEISKHPQVEPGQQFSDESNSQPSPTSTHSATAQSNIWLYILLALGLAVLLGLCICFAGRHKRRLKHCLSKLKAKMMRTKAKRTKGKKSSSQVSTPSKSSSNSLGSSTSNKSAISSGKSGSNASKSGIKTKTPIVTSKTSSSRMSK